MGFLQCENRKKSWVDQKSPLQKLLWPKPSQLHQSSSSKRQQLRCLPFVSATKPPVIKTSAQKLNQIDPRLPSWQIPNSSSIILPFKGCAPHSLPCLGVPGFNPISILQWVMKLWDAEQPQGPCTSQSVIAGFKTCILNFNPHTTLSLLDNSALGGLFGFNISHFD